jgi:LmbE family N-acetylglucosaminyl deacetylase
VAAGLDPAAAPGHRIVVVSPHLDDGVLSLGASIASWARAGATVELLTVLACDPDSEAPAGGWDRRGGFATEGQSARARREEDRRACALIGATPTWLPFGSVDYERHGDEEDVRRAVEDAVAGSDVVLLPGFPLTHPDHEWLVRAIGADDVAARGRLGLYAEQPYTRREGGEPQVAAWVAGVVGDPSVFAPVRARLRDRLAKWRAIRRYRSQLRLLGMHRSVRRGAHRYALAPEWVAWSRD